MQKKNIFITIAVLIVIVAVGGAAFFYLISKRASFEGDTLDFPPPRILTDSPPPVGFTGPVSEEWIKMRLQTAGNTISFRDVRILNPGFVAIHADKNGKPGAIIGTSGLISGSVDDLVISLNRPSKAGELLHAVAYRDDGDGVFEVPGADIPYIDKDGRPVAQNFLIFTEPSP